MQRTLGFALASIILGVVVFALKYAAYHVTGSVALYSDALESVVNIAAAVAAFLALRVSAIPADSSHPYGHHKVEYFSAVLEGVLIVVAALAIIREAYLRFYEPIGIEAPLQGILINMAATALNGIWCVALIREGRSRRSPALVADGKHLMTDVVTSVGVVVGIGLAVWLDMPVLDPAMAIVVAANIVWSGWRVIRESVGGLMDEATPQEDQDKIRELIAAHGEGAIEAHDLRTRHAGPATFIEFHLVVPADMRVDEAHEICDRVEQALKKAFEKAVITIHVEPEEKAKHSGIVVV